jgi:hypothetical protein
MSMSAERKMEYRTLLKKVIINHTAYVKASKELRKAYNALGTTSYPLCRHVGGVSRSGKSVLVTAFQDQAPPVRTEEGQITQIVYACIPPKGTTMGLLENLLCALGDPYWERGTESKKLARLINLLDKCQCRAIILDEFQHLSDKGQKNRALQFTVDFIKALVEPNKWLLIATGLPGSSRVIERDAQLRYRFPPTLMLPRFDWFDATLRGEFMGVLKAFQHALVPFDMPALSSEEMAMRFYLATGGLIGLVTKILQRSIEDAVEENRRVIEIAHLEEAFKNEIWFATTYADAGPFKMKLDSTSMGRCLQDLPALLEGSPNEDGKSGANILVKKATHEKPVTKAAHKREMENAL